MNADSAPPGRWPLDQANQAELFSGSVIAIYYYY